MATTQTETKNAPAPATSAVAPLAVAGAGAVGPMRSNSVVPDRRVAPYGGAPPRGGAPFGAVMNTVRSGPKPVKRFVVYLLDLNVQDITTGPPGEEASMHERSKDFDIPLWYKGEKLSYDGLEIQLTRVGRDGVRLAKLIGNSTNVLKDGTETDHVTTPVSLTNFHSTGKFADMRGTSGKPLGTDETTPEYDKLLELDAHLKGLYMQFRTNPAILKNVNAAFCDVHKGKKQFQSPEDFARHWCGKVTTATGKLGGSWLKETDKGAHLSLKVFKVSDESPKLPTFATAELEYGDGMPNKIVNMRDNQSYEVLEKLSVVHTFLRLKASLFVGGMGAGAQVVQGNATVFTNLGAVGGGAPTAMDFGDCEVEYAPPDAMLYRPSGALAGMMGGMMGGYDDGAETVVNGGGGNAAAP